MKKQLLLVISSMFVLAGCGPSVSESSVADSSVESSETSSSEVSSGESSNGTISSGGETSSSESSSSGGDVIDFASVKSKLSAAIANKDKVNGGTISKDEYGTPVTINYEFGSDAYGTFYHEHQDPKNPENLSDYNYTDKYFGKDSTGGVYGIQKSETGKLSAISNPKTTEASLNGYGLSFDYSTYYYGVEGIATFVLGIAETNTNKDLKISSIDGGYEINVGMLNAGEYSESFFVFDAKVMAGEIIESLEFSYSRYFSSDFTKDPETGVVYLNDGASADPTVVRFAQTSGTRTATNQIDIESMYASSFDLAAVTGYGETAVTTTIVDTYTVENGSFFNLTAINVLPETANMSIDTISAICESDGVVVNSFGGSTSIRTEKAGSYQIVVKTRKVTKTFTLVVTLPKATSFMVTAYAKNSDELAEGSSTYSSLYFSSDEDDSLTVYSGENIYLTGTMNPYTSDQTYRITSSSLTLDAVEGFRINQYQDPKTAYHFVAPAAGSYEITFISETNEISSTVRVDVIEPDLASIFSKEYVSDSIISKFTADSSDPKTGTVVIDSGNGVEETYAYSYDETTSIVSVIDGEGITSTKYKFALNAFYELYCYQASSNFFSQCQEYTIEYRMKGEWYGQTDKYTIGFSIYGNSNALSITRREDFENVVYINFTLEVIDSGDFYTLKMNDQKTSDWGTPKPLGTYLTEGKDVTMDKAISKISFPLTDDGVSSIVELVKESNPRG